MEKYKSKLKSELAQARAAVKALTEQQIAAYKTATTITTKTVVEYTGVKK